MRQRTDAPKLKPAGLCRHYTMRHAPGQPRAADGVYRLRAARKKRPDGALVLQGSEVAFTFIREALPLLARAGIDLEVCFVASAEPFDALPPARS